MYPPYGGNPNVQYVFVPTPGQQPLVTPQKSALEQIQDIEAHIEGLKKLKKYLKEEDKDEDKKKEANKKKGEPFKLDFWGIFGVLSVTSIPMVLLQLWMLDQARFAISAFLTVNKLPNP